MTESRPTQGPPSVPGRPPGPSRPRAARPPAPPPAHPVAPAPPVTSAPPAPARPSAHATPATTTTTAHVPHAAHGAGPVREAAARVRTSVGESARESSMFARGGVWTVPNVLSALRLLGVPVFLWLVLVPKNDELALLVLVLSGVTDYLDGWLARLLDQTSRLGEILDPVADRLYILAVVIGLGWREVIPWWMVLILPARDAFLWCLVPFLRTRGYSALPVHFLGKAATFNLLYAFPLLLLGDGDGVVALLAQVFGWAFAIWGIGLYWWAGLLYAWQVRKLLADRTRRAPDVVG